MKNNSGTINGLSSYKLYSIAPEIDLGNYSYFIVYNF